MSPRLSLEKVSYRKGEQTILSGLSLRLDPGEILGLVGPNGAGKSTLARIAAGVLEATDGCARLEGKRLGHLAPRERARRIAYAPQSGGEGLSCTVFEACLLGRLPHMGGSPGRLDTAIVEETLALLELEALAFRSMAELSGGERQRVLLARALVQETDILILDEPTSALDIANQLFVLRVLEERTRERGLSVMIALHDLSMAARFTDRLALLQNGRLHACGTWQETLTKDSVKEVYGVSAHIGLFHGEPVFVPHAGSRKRGETP